MAPGTSRKSAAISCAGRRIAAVVEREQAAGLVEFDVMTDGGEQIQNLAIVRSRVAHAIGGDHRQLQRARNANGGLVAPFLFALLVALQFDIDILAAEDSRQLFDRLAARRFAAARQRRSQRAFIAAGQADQAALHIAEDRRALPRLRLWWFRAS